MAELTPAEIFFKRGTLTLNKGLLCKTHKPTLPLHLTPLRAPLHDKTFKKKKNDKST